MTSMIVNSVKKIILKKAEKAYLDSIVFLNEEIKEFKKKEGKKCFRVLDIGVGSGYVTRKVLKGIKDIEIYGVDAFDRLEFDKVSFKKVNMDKDEVPFEKDFFDVIYSNQVFEHFILKNEVVKKCQKVLKKDGLLLIATENIASFDNIASLMLGQEPLNQHSYGTGKRINTFLSPHYGEELIKPGVVAEFGHKNVCSYFSLKRMIAQNEFKNVSIKSFGSLFELTNKIAPFYSRIIVAKAYKK